MKTLTIFVVGAAFAAAQIAENANGGYKTVEGRSRVAERLIAPDRDQRQKPQELVEAMGLKSGDVVADIGTGAGYMLPYLSRAAGPRGKVVAQDIFPDFLEKATARAEREKLGNVVFVKGTEKDANLDAGSVDMALALDSYHHYNYPAEMLAGLRKGLKDGGRLVIVEYYKRPGAMEGNNAVQHIRLDAPDLIREVEANGFKLVSQREHIKNSQYMAIFEKR
jgi:ubiquinone/menaquinone biosynthesis C-methylase UbiE